MCMACSPGMIEVLRHAASRRDFFKYMGAASASAFAATIVEPSPAFAQSAARTADVIFWGGPIVTMNASASRAEAVAIQGERILAVGARSDIEALRGPQTQVVELDGRALLPGMIEPHMHAVFVAFEDWIDVSPITTPSFEAVMTKLRDGASKARPGEWVRAQQFDPSITKGARIPTLADLDAIAPDNPFVMIESNGHVGYANSVAMRIAGLTRDTPNTVQARFGRDANGDLTGRLESTGAMQPFIEKMPHPTAAEMQARLGRLFKHASSLGYTTLHDCGIGIQAGAGDLALLDAAMAQDPPVRYRGMLVSTAMSQWETMNLKPGRGNDYYRIDGIKAWSDGSNQAFTGFQRENYLGRDSRGALTYALPELTEIIRRAHDAGWQVGVHANGDAAIDTTIEAYETVLKQSPRPDHRHRIEHCSLLHAEQIEKMHRLGLSPSFLVGHVRWWGKAFRDRILGPERARFLVPAASALKGGLRISLHSDWNVTPLGPLRCVEDVVARIMNEDGGVFFPEERIPIEAALRAVTIDAAWQCRMDDKVGSLEPGKLADLAVLEQDPTAVSSTAIQAIKVNQTWMAGKPRFVA
jgi:predicted amidohydrolase YtcJ